MPSDESSQVGCLISEKAAIKVEKEVEKTVEQGGKIVLGGKRNGAFYEPTVIVDVPKTADVAVDMEIFGPVVPIIGFDSDEEAIEIANKSIFGLSSCVFSRDQKRAFKVASRWKQAEPSSTAPASSELSRCRSAAGSTAALARRAYSPPLTR